MILATDTPLWVQFVLVGGAGAAGTVTATFIVWGARFGGRIQKSVEATERHLPPLTLAITEHGTQISKMHDCLDDVQSDVAGLKDDVKRVLAAVATNTAITSAARDEAEAR